MACVCACVLFLLGAAAPQASATTTAVPAGGDLQAALDAAQPGDTIVLAGGATYTGHFLLPVKGGNSFITVRSDAPESKVPAAGSRVGPEHAPFLAKLAAGDTSAPTLRTAPGAHHWRFELIEFVGNGGEDIITLGAGESQTVAAQMPHDLVFDRVYIHGDAVLGQKRGIALNSASTQIRNSFIADIKAVGIDSQAICGWNGAGPFVIENNYLEAAGENVMFGGADPSIWSLVPADITVRRNVLSKPLAWRSQKWSIKNALELKNARRVLVEGNVIENVWEAAQTGIPIVITPRNQDGTAPWSVVEDVTVQFNVIRHAGGVFNISGFDDERPSDQTRRIRIANNLAYDIDYAVWGGSARFVQIGNQPADIAIERNTVIQSGNIISVYGKPILGFVLRDNLMRHNTYGVIGDNQSAGNATIQAYFPGGRVERNVMAGGNPAAYPAGNYFPGVAEFDSAFVNVDRDNFTLVPGSSFRTAASDGGAVGADVVTLNAVTSGAASSVASSGATPRYLPRTAATLKR
jgi:hypothetical protein